MTGFSDLFLVGLTPGEEAVAQVAAPLAALALVAFFARGVPRLLLLAQVVYWGVSFVGRSLLLLSVRPRPTYSDEIADPRLFDIGYDYAIAHVLLSVQSGLWVYAALAAAFVLGQRLLGPPAEPLARQTPVAMATFAAMWGLGALARAAMYLTGSTSKAGEVSSANPYLLVLATLASLGALGHIVYFRGSARWKELAVIGFFVGSELAWGAVEQSKSPFMGAVLALAVRYLSAEVSRAKLVAMGAGAALVVGLFGWMQSFKVTGQAAIAASAADEAYPASVRSFLSIFRRFDLLAAATDTYYWHGGRWAGASDIARKSLLNLVPAQLGVVKEQSGVVWAKQVRGSSVDMSTISVSLADGHMNEGYLWGGLAGVFWESVFLLGMIAAVARCLRSRDVVLVVTLGLTFVALPPLFERGVLGVTETLGKSLQQGVIAGCLAAVIWLYCQLRRHKPGGAGFCLPVLRRLPRGGTRGGRM